MAQSRHGEYKVPGGKLVIIDLDVAGDRLANVSLSGDFFLEPPDALGDITRALEGAPADASEEELARLVEGGLREDAELIGFSAAAVATAVRRALR